MKDLRISMIQSSLIWEQAAANRQHFTAKIAALKGRTDLIILPEMFSTGFTMASQRLSEHLPGPTLEWMQEQAALSQAVITGSFIVREGKKCFNRLIWMRPDGSYATYDKRHLFTLAGEQQHYQAGQQRILVTLKGWRVLPLICYDLRFPVWSRNTEDYDLLIYVANWPERRRNAWKNLLVARAIENQVYTIGVNRIGEDGNGINHSGDSSLIDFAGEIHYQAAYLPDVFTTTLSLEQQKQFRNKFKFLADRDAVEIATKIIDQDSTDPRLGIE